MSSRPYESPQHDKVNTTRRFLLYITLVEKNYRLEMHPVKINLSSTLLSFTTLSQVFCTYVTLLKEILTWSYAYNSTLHFLNFADRSRKMNCKKKILFRYNSEALRLY